jgi:hypothetical protein
LISFVAVQQAEDDQRFGTEASVARRRQRLCEQGAGPRRLTRDEAVARRCNRAALDLVDEVGRREPRRLLEQVGCCCSCASRAGVGCSSLEHDRDALVGSFRA